MVGDISDTKKVGYYKLKSETFSLTCAPKALTFEAAENGGANILKFRKC